MIPLDMLNYTRVGGVLVLCAKNGRLLILWTRGIAITNFRPTRKPLSSRILGKTAAFHCYSNRTVREIFHLSAMQTRSSRTPQSSLDRSMCLGISKPRFFDHPLKNCMTPLQKLHGRVHHRSDPGATTFEAAHCHPRTHQRNEDARCFLRLLHDFQRKLSQYTCDGGEPYLRTEATKRTIIRCDDSTSSKWQQT